MSVKKTNLELFQLKNENLLWEFVMSLFAEEITFEVLDPHDLDLENHKIYSYPGKKISTQELDLKNTFSKYIDENIESGFLDSLNDDRKLIDTSKLFESSLDFEQMNKFKTVLNYGATLEGEDLETVKTYISKLEFFSEINTILKNAFMFTKEIKKDIYLCLSYASSDESKIEKIKQKLELPAVDIDWNTQISIWNSTTSLEGFREVKSALGGLRLKDMDTTWLFTLFFSFFFGFCLADGIYGGVVTMITGWLLLNPKTKLEVRKMSWMFFISGIFSTIIGALTGTWAGDLLSADEGKILAQLGIQDFFLFSFLRNLQIIDPINVLSPSPLNIYLAERGVSPIVAALGFSLVLGLLVILTGYVINTINLFLNAENEAGLASLSWLMLLFAIILSPFIIALNLPIALMYAALGVSGLMNFVFAQGDTFVSKIVGGLGSLWGLISFLSDIMSFTRLVAVGLTGGIIGSVINLLVAMVFESVNLPVLNLILLLILLVCGHAFNFVISLFGAYLNPLRLSYVEYLPKILTGSERNMDPVEISLTHHKLVWTTF
jgi:vacuolar-type H+-ATPase subunit I/STV1